MRTEDPGFSALMASMLCGINRYGHDFESICASAGVTANESFYPQDIRRIRSFLHGMPVVDQTERPQPPILCVRGTESRVGKTEVAGQIAGAFAYSGMRTLLIDADPQAGLTMMFGIGACHRVQPHLAELMQRCHTGQPCHMEQAVIPLYPDHLLDVLPASFSLADEHRLQGMAGWEQALKQLLVREQAFFSRYDIVIIDCAPDDWLIGKACLNICDQLLAVATFQASSLAALDGMAANIDAINAQLQRNVELHIVLNEHFRGDLSLRKARNVRARLESRHGYKFVHSLTIPDYVTDLRAHGRNQPGVGEAALLQAPSPWGSWYYRHVAQSIFDVFDRPMVNHGTAVNR